ncbi:ArsR family transcriptional regulator [Paraburkholderia sediminicola]|uniref:ArsR family transcriptional regulator n=1 Tax=Paraburkholderia sediminicola TaxID=458836 RepID=UPI0038B8B3E3
MTTSSVGSSMSGVPDELHTLNKDNDKPQPAGHASRSTPPLSSPQSHRAPANHDAPRHSGTPSLSAHRAVAAVFSRQTSGEAIPARTALPYEAAGSIPTLDVLSRGTRSAGIASALALARPAQNLGGSSGTPAAGATKAQQGKQTGQTTQPSDTLPGASIEEFSRLNEEYDTEDGYLPRNSEADSQIAQQIEDGLQQEMTGYPPQLIQFQQRETHLQGMLAELPESERQFYGGVVATLGAVYQLETSNDKRYAIDQKMTDLENAVREEATRVRNDPVDRVLSQFSPPMGAAYLNKEDRESVDYLDKLREDFLGAADADEREDIFQEASELKAKLQERISVEVGKRQRVKHAQWKEANGEVDRILKEAQAQTDPAKRYELIGRQLFEINPGQDELKDKVILAFTQRMHDSPELRDKLDTWHDQVSGPLNAHSVGAAKRYTDILRNLPPVSADYVRDLSDQYTAVLKDVSFKDYSITPAVRAEKLAGQIMEGFERVILGLTPLAPLADLQPSTLPDNVRMGLDYGSAFLGILAGEGWGIVKEISLAGKAISAVARNAELANMAGREGGTAGKSLVQTAGQALTEGIQAELTLNREAKAAERVLQEKTLAEAGPAIDPTNQLAHQSVGSTPYGSLVTYAEPDVLLSDLRPGQKPGILVDARGDRYIGLGGKAYHVRFDNDSDTWRVFKKGADLKPQYPVRLNESTHEWEINSDVGMPGGGRPGVKINDTVRQEVIRLLKEGELSRRKIAEKLGIHHTTVGEIAREENIGLSANDSLRRLALTPATRQRVIELLREGQLRPSQIARDLDICPSTVRKIAKQNHIPVGGVGRTRIKPEIQQEVIDLLRKGELSHRQIAKRFGINGATVNNIAKKNHIHPTAAALRNLKITPGTRQEIIRLLRDGGLTLKEIADREEVSVSTVFEIAAQERIRASGGAKATRGVTPEQVEQAFALKDQGKTTREIADAVKLPERKVRDIVANYNANTYKRSWWDTTPANRTAAIRQLDEGKAPKDVARDLGLPLETVRGIANQHRVARDSLASELLAEHKSPEDVAKSLGMSHDYVKRLAEGMPEGTHDIRFTSKDRDAAMDMFEKGYSRQDVATKLGISPWKAHSLANEFRTATMDSVTPQQLDDIVRALNLRDYSFTTGDLARATHVPESTIAVVEQEYAGGFLVPRPQSPQPGPSWAMSPAPADHYEWVPPLSSSQEIEAIRAMDEGRSLKDVAGQLKQPYAAVQRLYEDELPVVAQEDDPIDASPAELPPQGATVFSEEDKAEIRDLAQGSGLSASFIAGRFNVPMEDIQKVLNSNP